MSHFNEEQLKELECIFGLTRVVTINTLPVRDGIVTKEDIVWWRCDRGLPFEQTTTQGERPWK